jgi:cellobiose dehydrogenase (acceptor)
MRLPSSAGSFNAVLLVWAATWPTNTAASSPTSSYIDVDTGITFYGLESPTGYLFGMMLPQHPTTDFIAQIVTPLTDGAGWGGVSFGSSMVGPLLLVTW